jgi:hypothetical protein
VDDSVRAKLTGTSQLSLDISVAAPSGVVEWQVVSFDGATVQSGDLSFVAGDTTRTASLPSAVDAAKTWVLLSYELTSVTGTAAETLFRGRVSGSTQLTFERAGTGAPGTLTWYAVSFGNGTSVQSATDLIASGAATDTVSLNPVVPAKSIAATSGAYQRGGKTPYAAASNPGYATFTLDIGGGSQLSLQRGAAAGTTASVDWVVVDFF